MVRDDFIKFARRDVDTRPDVSDDAKAEDEVSKALEEHRAQLANDDGRGSFGSYKCPIF